MNTKRTTPVLAALLWAAAASLSLATTYTTLDDPLATRGTSAVGISGNNIVGHYQDASGSHGFLYNGTSYTTLNEPLGTYGTFAVGISGNNVVGFYEDGPTFANNHGFLYDGTTWTTLDDPLGAAFGTYPAGSSGNNVIGCYLTYMSYHGFLYNGTSYTTLDDPLATTRGNYSIGAGTTASGIYGNKIVGDYEDDAFLGHGFIYDGTNYTTLDDPLGTSGTHVTGISGNNIVGYYNDSAGIPHGFLATVPEPSTFVLAGMGLLGALTFIRQRRRRSPFCMSRQKGSVI